MRIFIINNAESDGWLWGRSVLNLIVKMTQALTSRKVRIDIRSTKALEANVLSPFCQTSKLFPPLCRLRPSRSAESSRIDGNKQRQRESLFQF